jgi:hypothetical protein
MSLVSEVFRQFYQKHYKTLFLDYTFDI